MRIRLLVIAFVGTAVAVMLAAPFAVGASIDLESSFSRVVTEVADAAESLKGLSKEFSLSGELKGDNKSEKVVEASESQAGSENLESQKMLELQQERLVGEIIKYRRRVRELEATIEEAGSGGNENLEEIARKRELNGKLKDAVDKLKEQLVYETEENKKLSEQVRECSGKLASSDENATGIEGQFVSLKEENTTLREQLIKAQAVEADFAELKIKYASITSELLLKEKELEIERGVESHHAGGQDNAAVSAAAGRPERAAAVEKDALVVEVKVAKANLRSGPGEEHSPVMQIGKGARLVVESRHGDWFRVITPTSSRAYIRADVVRQHRVSDSRARMAYTHQPKKAPRRVANDGSLVPFGNVTGYQPSGRDGVDSLAVQKLKASLGRAR